MKSPFPGMDPYLEAQGLWATFHQNLVVEIQRELAGLLPANYFIQGEERSYIVLMSPDGKEVHPFAADARIASWGTDAAPTQEGGGTAVVEPMTETGSIEMLPFIATEIREAFVEIYESKPEERLVTCIELLSPSNKRRGSTGQEVYLRKRQALFLSSTNLVEIDLLRLGERMPMLSPWPNSPYTLLAARHRPLPRCTVWSAFSHRPLQAIKIPLSYPDADLSLNLQPLIDGIYERYRFRRRIDYTEPLLPPLTAEEASALEQQLREIPSPVSSPTTSENES